MQEREKIGSLAKSLRMAESTLLILTSIKVVSIKSDVARFAAFDFFNRVGVGILFLQSSLPTL